MRKLRELQDFPIKIVTPNEEEKRALTAFGYDLGKLALSIKRIDETSKEYKTFEEKMDKINIFLQVAINIDLLYPVETEKLWEHLELSDSEDYIGMAEWLGGIGMEKKECEDILNQIAVIKKLNVKEYSEWIERTGFYSELLESESDLDDEGS